MNIIEAIENNDIEFVKKNVGNFNPNQIGQYGYPLLHRATHLGYLEITKLLIDNGADIDILDINHFTPLHSIIEGNEDNWFYVIELLINNGAYVDAVDVNGDKAINYAYDRDMNEIIDLLKEYGAEYDGKETTESKLETEYALGMVASYK